MSSGPKTGAVTLIQRFGSALNLNPHLHMLFLDGAYRFGGRKARFHRARRATPDQLEQLLDTLSRRAPGRVDVDKPLAPMNWAQRLKRVFQIDIEACPHCGGKLRASPILRARC